MNPKQPFTKDDPAYPGMIGLIAATTATDCKCSRCERLRSYLPPDINRMAQTESFKTQTKQMYEDEAAIPRLSTTGRKIYAKPKPTPEQHQRKLATDRARYHRQTPEQRERRNAVQRARAARLREAKLREEQQSNE